MLLSLSVFGGSAISIIPVQGMLYTVLLPVEGHEPLLAATGMHPKSAKAIFRLLKALPFHSDLPYSYIVITT